MELRQLYAPADPGFRLDLDGTARFLHEGYTVTVQVRRATPEDGLSYYQPQENDSHDVVMTGTVTLEDIAVGAARAVANERDALSMREAMEEVLRDVVDDARRTVARLSARVEQIDSKYRAQQP
ncbi:MULTISPECIES: hypothetical protein [Streptomyces]|uniref:Regulatory protein n=1 Tax=Streptomyces griseiscabiei TaxID=2993540 RepID=A0ABU4LJZ3_9ACTN|nr:MULTISPECIES: hypothetical protein [Streptomyces]MBZ3908597.1 hypothetical protein [Streptomyces griseiscabiei]MDX2916022.1 hypothetical protein [Streptomyces griseiscabiei]